LISAYKFAYTLTSGCAHALINAQIVHPALGDKVGETQLVYEGTGCLAWGVILTEREIGALSMSSLFLTRVGVYVGVCLCTRTHAHTLQPEYSDVRPGVA